MTTSNDIPELPEFDAAESTQAEAGPAMPSVPEATLMTLRAGLPCPAYNPRADKAYYKFLFAGVLMLLGCLMPFGPQMDMTGYKTMSGGIFTLIALGLVWTSWGAINTGKISMKWVFLAFIPFLAQLMALLSAFSEPAVMAGKTAGLFTMGTWGEVFAKIGAALPNSEEARAAGREVAEFFKHFGPGRIFLFLGALLAELAFIQGVMGGAKKLKQEKLARQAAGAERRRR